MSINENKEFETINRKTSERKEADNNIVALQEQNKSKAKTKTIALMIATLLLFVVAVIGIRALEMSGWINSAFQIVLLTLAECATMFKIGYYWREVKN